ncbi:hypothetical protein ACFYOV_14645 [Streptomyces sp. NPDC005931]|uniref:hypothetical protein n=1 Tax=Streptomyces sp. NPDC005931 TaxID=3364737 RepID=UPI0036A0431B
MSEFLLHLDPALARRLHDLADAQDRTPEDVAREAVRRHVGEEAGAVRAVAGRLAREHAELLRRLGE